MFFGWSRRCAAVSALVLMGAVSVSRAQNMQDVTELDLITVVGEGNGEVLTTVADKAELERKMLDDITDLGRLDAAVTFSANSKSVSLRGLDRNRVLTTIDGIRLPWLADPRDSARGGLDSIDFDTLSAIDLTRGADSVRHGSGALGGVIGFRTLDPEELIEDGRNWGAIVKGTHDSADASWRANAALAARFRDTYLLFQGGYRIGHELDNQGTLGGFRWDRTLPDPLDSDQINLLLKLHQHVEGGHRFRFTGEMFNHDERAEDMTGTYSSPARGGDASQLYEEGSLHAGELVRRERLSAGYDFLSPAGEGLIDEAHLTAYWLRQRLNSRTDGVRLRDARADAIAGDPYRYGFPSGPYSRDNQLGQTSYGIFGDGEKHHKLGGLGHTLRFGGEFYRQETHQYSSGSDNCPDVASMPDFMGPQACRFLHTNASDMPAVDSLAFAIFAEDDMELPGNFTLTPGLRFDWFDHKPVATPAYRDNPNYSGMPDANRGTHLSAKLRGAWQATPDLEIYAQWAQAFRAPTALELYQNFGAPGSYARIGNPELVPETGNGFEIGAHYDHGRLALTASLFRNSYRNFIDMVQLVDPADSVEYPIAGIVGYRNRARVRIHGAELRGQWNFATDWHGWGSLAWTVGRDTVLDEHLNSIAPLRAILGIGYATPQWGADLSVTLAAARDKVGPGGFRAPAYGVADFTAWWEPEQVEGLRLQAGIFNLFDTRYWNALDVPDGIDPAVRDRYSEPGRFFRLTVSKRF